MTERTAWTDEERTILKELAPAAWDEWQWSWGNPSVMEEVWEDQSEDTQRDWTQLLANIIANWEKRKEAQTA